MLASGEMTHDSNVNRTNKIVLIKFGSLRLCTCCLQFEDAISV